MAEHTAPGQGGQDSRDGRGDRDGRGRRDDNRGGRGRDRDGE